MSTPVPAVPRPFRRRLAGEGLELLDQTRLPGRVVHLRLTNAGQVAEAIRSLRVRGAPAIGLVAAHGVALEAEAALSEGLGAEAFLTRVRRALDDLAATRPTGVNLSACLEGMGGVLEEGRGLPLPEQVARLVDAAAELEADDAGMCRAIGETGLDLIPRDGAVVLTHCNAGALATGGIGTALAPVYVAAERGIPVRVLACEARPVLQGSRLTAWELDRAGIPVEVIPDSAAGSLMAEGEVDLVLVGADRIAANGDTANKIGTYALAVLAAHHGIPFHVAAPRTTFDLSQRDGRRMIIEERDGDEVRRGLGRLTTPRGVPVRNPAFDVTPAHLVTGFITDRGILHPPFHPPASPERTADPSSPTPEETP